MGYDGVVQAFLVGDNFHPERKYYRMLDELISKIFNREIIARDRNRFHHLSKMGFLHAMTAG